MSNETWNCPNCGKQEVTSNLCPNCGTKKPEAKKITQEEMRSDPNPGKNEGTHENTGRLEADQQWYEKDPSLLEGEKAGMAIYFPEFKLEHTEDGRLAWTGTLTPGIWRGFNASEDDLTAKQSWEVKAIYENNHPSKYSVKVFLVNPTIDTVIKEIGWVPSPFNNYDYLCDRDFTLAAPNICRALSWLTVFELVMTGELTKEEFNEALDEVVN